MPTAVSADRTEQVFEVADLESWRRVVSSTLAGAQMQSVRPAAFEGRIRRVRVGDLALVDMTASAHVAKRSSVGGRRKGRAAMTTIADHDAYIAAAPEPFQPSLTRLRELLAHALPEAEEIVAYDMPGFMIGGSVVASYAAFSKQCGLYLLPGAISGHAGEIAAAGFRATRTGITFPPSKPIPDDLVERLARASREDAGV